MLFAFQVFQAGLIQKMPTVNPEDRGIEIGHTLTAQIFHGSLPDPLQEMFLVRGSRIVPKDTPLHRGMGALNEHYRSHPLKQAITIRMMAFYFLFNDVGRKKFTYW